MYSPHDVDSPPRPPRQRPAALWAAVLGLCSAVLLVLVGVGWRPLLAMDGDISRTTHRWAVEQPGLTQAARVLTDWVWDPWAMRVLCAVAALVLAWRYASRWTPMWLVVTVALATALQQWLKAALDRARPVWSDPLDSAGYAAFPSGHAMTATAVCGLLLWLLRHHGASRAVWRTALVLAVVSVIGVGLTRVWLGVHWASDVLGGWIVGALVVAVAVWIHQRRVP